MSPMLLDHSGFALLVPPGCWTHGLNTAKGTVLFFRNSFRRPMLDCGCRILGACLSMTCLGMWLQALACSGLRL